MAKSGMIRARVEPELKREAEALFSELGFQQPRRSRCSISQVTIHRGYHSPLGYPMLKPSTRCNRPVMESALLSTPV